MVILRRQIVDVFAPVRNDNSNISPRCDLGLDLSTFKIYSVHLYP